MSGELQLASVQSAIGSLLSGLMVALVEKKVLEPEDGVSLVRQAHQFLLAGPAEGMIVEGALAGFADLESKIRAVDRRPDPA